VKLKTAILTISDRSSRGEREDRSGPALQKAVESQGWEVSGMEIIPDEKAVIQQHLIRWADSGEHEVILTTGGTGFSPRDVTPEATRSILDRKAPGLTEAMRAESIKITPHAMLSRAEAGIRRQVLIVNLPGSPQGAVENFLVIAEVLPHAVELLQEQKGAESGHRLSASG